MENPPSVDGQAHFACDSLGHAIGVMLSEAVCTDSMCDHQHGVHDIGKTM
jgi:hypothetical protein